MEVLTREPRARRWAWPLVLRRLAPLLWWSLFVAFEWVAFQSWQETPLVTAGFVLKDLLAAVAGYYFFARVVLPRLVLRRRWLLTGLGLLAIYYVWGLCSYGYYALLQHSGLISANAHDYMHRVIDYGLWGGVFSWRAISMGISDFVVTVLPPILIRFVRFLLTTSNQSLRLERENLTLELSFLKAQVNPHFLFNTLNNIYTMVVKQDARAPVMVQHLTDLMHYTVYESDAEKVPLSREIGFLEDYLELERLRYGRHVSIRYQKSGPFDEFRITPLLFFPFVENAFKHGVDSSLEASWVSITLAVHEGQLHFEVSNSLPPAGPPTAFGGVGVANVQKRLALHYPPPDYQLTIGPEPADQTYRVVLVLRLDPVPSLSS
ncbi:sensor histidine kinase [Hymenobacter chitinivorans]|uniref:Histidine kinase n=1 Tax=Hymenobacter chitinivorans DSM 11115 TaxID=1121954 RepID=A0A2M9BQI7_9BACT|nr:sensor histidine kinase [Hymenobacter chitinivorans]PJJ60178.1 histidine kinase [Hymenobacter chitinivorans DSM 11115]